MVLRFWCGKLKLSSGRSRWFSFHHHHSLTNNGSNTKIIITRDGTRRTSILGRQYTTLFSSTVSSRNGIIDICGSVDAALKGFNEMPEKKKYSETWCLMMKCFVINGYGKEALDLFTRFKEEKNNKPDGEMFKELFSAFTLIGDVKEGLLHFKAMYKEYGIVPSMEHYHSVTKMLAKSGHLEEALNFVERMPMEPNVQVWETLMNLSRVHGDLELGDRCAEIVEKLDATRLDNVSSSGLVSQEFVKEEPNYQAFEDTLLYQTLMSLRSQILEMGYVPNFMAYNTKAMKKQSKEEQVFYYREPLAFVMRILSSRPRSSVLVLTNLRISEDCHNILKLMSLITGRELSKRDAKRFHNFKNGACSCNDCW